MATRVIYLDIDDEITSAAARVRGAEGSRVAVVLPHGSRVATSRINFRLLARDAQTNGKQLAVISGDAATRALAASAGLPIFATLAEYESSVGPETTVRPERAGGRRRSAKPRADATSAEATSATAAGVAGVTAAGAAGVTGEGTAAVADAVPTVPDPSRTARRTPATIPAERVVADTPERTSERLSPDVTDGRSSIGLDSVGRSLRRSTGRLPLIAVAAVLGLALVVGGVGAFLFLPTATAVITPREASIGPLSLRIVANTATTAPDAVNRVVPAVTRTIEVEAGQTFAATGKRVEQEKAIGTVRFRNKDFTSSNTIQKGSVVSTQSGVRYRTDRAVTVPRAELVGLQIFPASASVKVTAVDGGPDGNVEPNTILVIPRGEDPLTLDVTNPDATTGGTREEFQRITQEDVDAASTTLRAQLDAAFAERLVDPALGDDGTTVFPATASLGAPIFSVDIATLVGKEVESFDLGASASGTVIAVDEGPVQSVAEANIVSLVEAGYQLIEGSSQVEPSPAVVEGGVITFPVVVTARQVAVLDPGAIEAEILGQPLASARAILERYGRVELSVWPDWVGTIPTIDGRVEVTTATPVDVVIPEASPVSSP